MKTVANMGEALTLIDSRWAFDNRGGFPSAAELRAIWDQASERGRIDMFDAALPGDAKDTSIGLIVSGDAGHLIRVTLSRAERLNLARALLEGC